MLFWILLTSPDIARISDDNAVNDAPGGVASMMDRGRATLGAGPGVADPLGTGSGQWEPAVIPRQYNGARWEQLPTGEYELRINHFRALIIDRGGWFQWELYRNDNELFGENNPIENGMGLTLPKAQFAIELSIHDRENR